MAKMRLQLAALIVLALGLAGGTLVYGQASVGTILGVVKDSSGASVPEATVTITNTDTTTTRTATTGDDGAFRIPALPVGHYTVRVEKSGFRPETQQGLTLDVAQDLVINTTLQVGTSAQEVVVTGEAPVVTTTNGTLGGLVNPQKMEDLPLNGRNYIDLTLLQPGIAFNASEGNTGPNAGTSFSSNGASQHSNYITLDGTSVMNQFALGSASQTGATLGVDGIKEFKVISNMFGAEYGMVMGSQVVMVSKGGTNAWHGDAFEYIRNSIFDARNYFDYGFINGGSRLPHFERNNFGGSFGGPIKKDKTFFYAVYEGLRENLGVTMLDTVMPAACHSVAPNPANPGFYQFAAGGPGGGATADANAKACGGAGTALVGPGGTGTVTQIPGVIIPLLNLFPAPNLPLGGFTYPANDPETENYGQMRVDQNISAADTLFGRYTFDKGQQTSPNTFSSSSPTIGFPQEVGFFASQNQFLTLAENHIFSPVILNTARISFSRTNSYNEVQYPLGSLSGPQYSFIAGDPIGALSISPYTGFGNNHANTVNLQNVYTLSDDLFYTRGRHAIKIGFLINRFNQAIFSTNALYGTVSFNSATLFMQGMAKSYVAEVPGSIEDSFWIYNTAGFYIQDDWRVTSRLTLNLGLRDEFMTEPHEINGRSYSMPDFAIDPVASYGNYIQPQPKTNFMPRVGFGWDIFGNGKTALRGGFGMFYDVGNIGAAIQQGTTSLPPISGSSTVTNPPQLLSLPITFGSSVGNTLRMLMYNMVPAHGLQYNLTTEQQLPLGLALSVSYVGFRGLDLLTIGEGNPTIPSAMVNGYPYWAGSAVPGVTVVRTNPHWGTCQCIYTGGDSWYNSLQVVVNKRLSRGLEVQSSYVWSRSEDDTQGQQGGQDCNTSGCNKGSFPNNLRLFDKGLSGFDLRNRIFVNLLYHFPNMKSDNFAAKLTKGWWMGNIVTIQSGYPFTPVLSNNRSNSLVGGSQGDRVDVNTAASIAAGNCSVAGNCAYTPIPYDPHTVITGNPNMWFNPLMFSMAPMVVTPGGAICTTSTCGSTGTKGYGTLGNAGRDILEGPGLGTWHFSLAKDTPLRWLGEAGNVEFRAEFFNILNRANFSTPSGGTFQGAISDFGSFSETPVTNVGSITSTGSNTSRQIQFALKILF